MCIPLNPLKSSVAEVGLHFMDEPTNDLDITTLTILEDYLDNFPGIVIVVSHDRYFLDRIAGRIFAFEENGKIHQYEGGYTDYRNRINAEAEVMQPTITETKKADVEKSSWKQHSTKLKFSYKEQKDYETIEGEIAALEEKIEELEKQILLSATDFVKLNRLTQEKQEAEELLEEKMDRWMYLEDLKAQIDAQ